MIIAWLPERDASGLGQGGWNEPRTRFTAAYRSIESSAAEAAKVRRSPRVRAAIRLNNKCIVPEDVAYLVGKDRQHSHCGCIGLRKVVHGSVRRFPIQK